MLFSYFASQVNAQTSKDVKIGMQIWMTKNLNVDKFRNGELIPEAHTLAEWDEAGQNEKPIWCYYNFDPANGAIYGKLYNGHAISDPRELAPIGYHIPKDIEFELLYNYLGKEIVAGKKMKSTSGWIGKGNGTNTSGFSGLPGGNIRMELFGIGQEANFWAAAVQGDAFSVWILDGEYGFFIGKYGNYTEDMGMSVRCIKN